MKKTYESPSAGVTRGGFKLRSTWPFVLTEADMIHPEGVSLTVPDQTYSVRDLVERIVPLGLDPSAYRVGQYKIDGSDMDHEDDDLESIGRMTLVDRLAEAGKFRLAAQQAENKLREMEHAAKAAAADRSAGDGGEGSTRPSKPSKSDGDKP